MTERSPSIRAIFEHALECEPGAERDVFLEAACAGDPERRKRVDELLAADAAASGFLEEPAVDGSGVVELDRAAELAGAAIGPYRLVERIGEGGFGVVFLAQQEQPVRRKVALKIIKPGMDTRQVVARFEAERQALAIMDHPNIAKVLDAGATERGHPYFVMELVPGVCITEYCDSCGLTIRERLELFIQVCHAVQHAHQKGVIHRDLKPNNVLIALQDGEPTPKIIDFGVAKAIGQRLTDRTLTVGFAQMIGTPMYMSPEQAELSPLGVDTRSDVYSLGALLYELLTGATPFDQEKLRAASYDELRRIIREEEPARPSRRISTLAGDLATTVAERRRADARRLTRQVNGELDWIAMKCLEKDRNRRYQTALELAADIQRFLKDEAVEACPPSAAYRFRKFAIRNKVALAIAATAMTSLLALVAGLAISNRIIAAERDEKAKALAEKVVALKLAKSQKLMMYYKDSLYYRPATIGPKEIDALYRDVSALFEEVADAPSTALDQDAYSLREQLGHQERDLAYLMGAAGRTDEAKNAFERSIATFTRLVEVRPLTAHLWQHLADSHRELGRLAAKQGLLTEAERHFRRAIGLHEHRWKKLPGQQPRSGERAAAYADLARLLIATGRWKAGAPLIARALDTRVPAGKFSSAAAADTLLGVVLLDPHLFDEPLATYAKIIEDQPDEADAWGGRGQCHLAQAKFAEAEADFAKAIDLAPGRADFWTGRARSHFQREQWEKAIDDYSQAILLQPDAPANWHYRGLAAMNLGKWGDAVRDFTELINRGPIEPDCWRLRAIAYARLEKPDEAVADLRDAIQAGYVEASQLEQDRNIDLLRESAAGKQLIEVLRARKG